LFLPAPHAASARAAASASFSIATLTPKVRLRSVTGFWPFQWGKKLTSPISPVKRIDRSGASNPNARQFNAGCNYGSSTSLDARSASG
jgi:hypothetical protein